MILRCVEGMRLCVPERKEWVQPRSPVGFIVGMLSRRKWRRGEDTTCRAWSSRFCARLSEVFPCRKLHQKLGVGQRGLFLPQFNGVSRLRMFAGGKIILPLYLSSLAFCFGLDGVHVDFACSSMLQYPYFHQNRPRLSSYRIDFSL